MTSTTTPPPAETGEVVVTNVQSTTLNVTVPPVATARAYEVRYRVGAGALQFGGIFTYSRNMVIQNLTQRTTTLYSPSGMTTILGNHAHGYERG